VVRQQRHRVIQRGVHLGLSLANGQAAHRIAGQV
jgi:hypothetical protein